MPAMTDASPLGLAALARQLQARQISATELAEQSLAAIHDQRALNAFLHVDAALTMAEARAADARIKAGDTSPLVGIPVAHKDVFVTRGWRTTAGSKMLANYV